MPMINTTPRVFWDDPATAADEVLFYAFIFLADGSRTSAGDNERPAGWEVWERSNTPRDGEPFVCVWEVDAPDRETAQRIAYERAAARGIPAENVDSY